MKVEPLAISRYKIHRWYNKKTGKDFWGIDVIIDGKSFSVKDDKPLFFNEKQEAIKQVKSMNKELRQNRINHETI